MAIVHCWLPTVSQSVPPTAGSLQPRPGFQFIAIFSEKIDAFPKLRISFGFRRDLRTEGLELPHPTGLKVGKYWKRKNAWLSYESLTMCPISPSFSEAPVEQEIHWQGHQGASVIIPKGPSIFIEANFENMLKYPLLLPKW